MNVPTKLAAFALALAVLFGGGYAVGAAVGPFDDADTEHEAPPAPHDTHGSEEDQ